ncbi:MAG: methyltransferase domain-containing protein [Candidatus Omnitrophota bacterium]
MGSGSYCFSDSYEEGSRKSARVIVPLVLDLVRPKSVIDVGCGLGSWLAVFEEFGIKDFLGVDGDWIDEGLLKIQKDKFVRHDIKKPFNPRRCFDLVVSMEVGEHLPPESAGVYVDILTGLGPVVLFSAAIPHQGGGPHLNEQWPDYWAGLFEKKGFTAVDAIRKRIWSDNEVHWWYAQNALMFVDERHLAKNPSLQEERRRTSGAQLSIVHPRRYLGAIETLSDPRNMEFGKVLKALPNLAEKAFKRAFLRKNKK